MGTATVSDPVVLGIIFVYTGSSIEAMNVSVLRTVSGGGLEADVYQSESRDVWDELTAGQQAALEGYLETLLGLGS